MLEEEKYRICLDDGKQLNFVENIGGDDDLLQCPKCNKYYISNLNKLEKVEKDMNIKIKKHRLRKFFTGLGSGISVLLEILFKIILPIVLVGALIVGVIYFIYAQVQKDNKEEIASRKTIQSMKVVEKKGSNKILFDKDGQQTVFTTSDKLYDVLQPSSVVDVTYNKDNEVKDINFTGISTDDIHLNNLKVIKKSGWTDTVTFEVNGEQFAFKTNSNSSSLYNSFVEGSTYNITIDDSYCITQGDLITK